jgi:hypothetical protein
MATNKRTTKKKATVKKARRPAKRKGVTDTRLSMSAAAKALDASAQTVKSLITVLNSQSESRAKQKPSAVLKVELGTLQELVAQLVENGNRLGANADALQQALTATYPRIAEGARPTKEDVKGLVLDKIVAVLGHQSPDGALLDSLARLANALA